MKDKKALIEELWGKWGKYKETAEQYEFPLLATYDLLLVPAYEDLMKNWNDEHADIFIRGLTNQVFPRFGIK